MHPKPATRPSSTRLHQPCVRLELPHPRLLLLQPLSLLSSSAGIASSSTATIRGVARSPPSSCASWCDGSSVPLVTTCPPSSPPLSMATASASENLSPPWLSGMAYCLRSRMLGCCAGATYCVKAADRRAAGASNRQVVYLGLVHGRPDDWVAGARCAYKAPT